MCQHEVVTGTLRIIAGTYRSRKLVVPAGDATRPMADRVKESLFSALATRVQGNVLDLFAGSGALGLESLSRGASRAVFVDQSKPAVQAIQKNIESLELEDQTQVLLTSAEAALHSIATEGPFDLVFVAPPYAYPDTQKILEALNKPEVLNPDATIVVERSADSEPLVAPPGFLISWERRYGGTLVYFLTRELK